MKKKRVSLIICTVLVFVLCLTGCSGSNNKDFNAEEKLNSLLTEVTYSSELEDIGDVAGYIFTGLPEGTQVKMYDATGEYADELVMFTAAQASDTDAIKTAIETHLAELEHQLQNYHPEEVSKATDAVVYSNDVYVFLCVTSDTDTANKILS